MPLAVISLLSTPVSHEIHTNSPKQSKIPEIGEHVCASTSPGQNETATAPFYGQEPVSGARPGHTASLGFNFLIPGNPRGLWISRASLYF